MELDLKYRPRRFADVIGNTAVVKLLLTRSREGSLSGRSMMFGGPKGCGKTTLGRIVAAAISCSDLNDGEPCGVCDSCISLLDETSTNFDEYDAATQGTVERVRSLIEDLDYESSNDRPRVVMIDEAHRLSKNSQDALLKAMEDRRFVGILCTTEARKIADPIRSRVEEYSVSPPLEAVLVSHMEKICKAEGLDCEREALSIMAKNFDNCPRQCVCVIDTLRVLGGVTAKNARQIAKYDRSQTVVNILHSLDSDPGSALSWLDDVSLEGAVWIRDTMVAAISSAMRQSVGARTTFPIETTFFANRGMGWADLAHKLGALDKPSMADLEAALLGSVKTPPNHWVVTQPQISTYVHRAVPDGVPAAPTPVPPAKPSPTVDSPPDAPRPSAPAALKTEAPAVQVLKAEPKPAPVEPKVNKHLEVDGVRFSSEENLTSLDSKIEKGSSGPPPPPDTHTATARVELDKRYVPLPEKEFASGLIKRLKGG